MLLVNCYIRNKCRLNQWLKRINLPYPYTYPYPYRYPYVSPAGGTNTYGALQKVRRDVLRPEKGNRLDVPDVVVVLTDGESWHKGRTINQALLLREQGVQVTSA